MSYSTYCKGASGGLKNIFPIKQSAKRLAHRKLVVKGSYYHPDLAKDDLIYNWETQASLSALRRCGKGPGFRYPWALIPHTLRDPGRAGLASQTTFQGPAGSFFAVRLCPQLSTPPLPASKLGFSTYFPIYSGDYSFHEAFLSLQINIPWSVQHYWS